MKSLMFRFDDLDSELPAIQFDNGDWYFSAQETCVYAELTNPGNSAFWVRTNVPSKWVQEIKLPGKKGRPSLYLSKPGFFWTVCQGKSEVALRFRDWVFEDLIPKIDRGEVAIVSSPQQALAIALPNTDAFTQAALQRRDQTLNRIWALEDAHDVIPYCLSGHKSKEHAVLNACSRSLIHGHDYWYSEEHKCWQMFQSSLEYLVAFARNRAEINLKAFGNTHVVLNMTRFLVNDEFPQPTNSFAPRVRMEASALMKAGLTLEWYPVSMRGLQHFSSVWDGSDRAVWSEFRQLCATLDTCRYARAVRAELHEGLYRGLEEREWLLKKHPLCRYLWTLESVNPPMMSPLSMRQFKLYGMNRYPRTLQQAKETPPFL